MANKNYMSIAVSVLTTSCVARNSGGVARQESNPQSATAYSSVRCAAYKESPHTNRHIWFLPTRKSNTEKPKEPVLLPALEREFNKLTNELRK